MDFPDKKLMAVLQDRWLIHAPFPCLCGINADYVARTEMYRGPQAQFAQLILPNKACVNCSMALVYLGLKIKAT